MRVGAGAGIFGQPELYIKWKICGQEAEHNTATYSVSVIASRSLEARWVAGYGATAYGPERTRQRRQSEAWCALMSEFLYTAQLTCRR